MKESLPIALWQLCSEANDLASDFKASCVSSSPPGLVSLLWTLAQCPDQTLPKFLMFREADWLLSFSEQGSHLVRVFLWTPAISPKASCSSGLEHDTALKEMQTEQSPCRVRIALPLQV